MSQEYHSKDKNGVPRSGQTVDNLLTKIEDLDNATQSTSGMMSAEDKTKLDSLEDDQALTIRELEELLNF